MNKVVSKKVKGGLLAPFRLDERTFPILHSFLGTEIDLTRLRRSEFPHSLRTATFNTYLNYKLINDFRCSYTQMACYYVNWVKLNNRRSQLPWGMTREHLLSTHKLELDQLKKIP